MGLLVFKRSLRANEKFHLLVSTNNAVKIKLANFDITNSKSEKLLGVNFDHKLSFDDHISELCKKSRREIHALSNIYKYVKKSVTCK